MLKFTAKLCTLSSKTWFWRPHVHWDIYFGFKSCEIWLQSKADAFEYADQVLERWYPSVEEGNDKGIVVLVTSQKEGAITGGPAFVQAVGETILDATVSENLPGNLEFSSHSLNWHMIISILSATSSVWGQWF